jgi:hypothetical protein
MPDTNAEFSLRNAAKNNPYFTCKNVGWLINYARWIRIVTRTDYITILQTMTRLICLGRKLEQIQKIVKLASLTTDFCGTANKLNNDLNIV